MARGDSYQLQGQQGGVVMTTGDISSGPFRWIQVVTDTIFDGLEGNLSGSNTDAIMYPAGIGIGGNITYVEVQSGTVIAYYA
jgi:hypothetical protein